MKARHTHRGLRMVVATVLVLSVLAGASTPTVSATVLFSDSFDRAAGSACGTAVDPSHPNMSLGLADNAFGGTQSQGYIGVKGIGSCNVVGTTIDNGTVYNGGAAYGGGAFQVAAGATCCAWSIAVGQDLNIQADVLLPLQSNPGATGTFTCDVNATIATLYFRTRNAYTGDGVRGGSSSGFRVELDSVGQLRVVSNNTGTLVAMSTRPSAFDPSIFHTLLVSVQGSPGTLRVTLDGHLQVFEGTGGRHAGDDARPARGGRNQSMGPPASSSSRIRATTSLVNGPTTTSCRLPVR